MQHHGDSPPLSHVVKKSRIGYYKYKFYLPCLIVFYCIRLYISNQPVGESVIQMNWNYLYDSTMKQTDVAWVNNNPPDVPSGV